MAMAKPLPRSIWEVWKLANGRNVRRNNRRDGSKPRAATVPQQMPAARVSGGSLPRILKVLTIGRLAATLEQQRLTATRFGGSCREGGRVWTLANGRLERPNNRRYVQANSRLQRWNSNGWRPQSLVEAAARKLPRGARGMDAVTTKRYAGKRPARHFKRFKGLKPVKRQPWTPIRSHCCGRGDALSHCCGLVVAFACGRARGMDALTIERYAGKRPARHLKGFKGLKPVKRQPWTPITSHCCGRGDALSHCCGLVVAFACGRGACWACWGTVCLRSWALCMREWRVLGSVQANGRLQRWNSRGWRLQGLVQPAGGVLEAL